MLENFGRCGLRHMTAETADATVEDETLVGTVDFVIADVPCSGLGIIGKKRDIKYNITRGYHGATKADSCSGSAVSQAGRAAAV